MTPLQATFLYVDGLRKMGYSKEQVDQAYRQAAPPSATDAVLIQSLAKDLDQRQTQLKQARV